jgi:hypothetical protein
VSATPLDMSAMGHKADIASRTRHFRSSPQSGHPSARFARPLCAISGPMLRWPIVKAGSGRSHRNSAAIQKMSRSSSFESHACLRSFDFEVCGLLLHSRWPARQAFRNQALPMGRRRWSSRTGRFTDVSSSIVPLPVQRISGLGRIDRPRATPRHRRCVVLLNTGPSPGE